MSRRLVPARPFSAEVLSGTLLPAAHLPPPTLTQALGYSVTVLGFGWYNYAKLQPKPAAPRALEAQRLLHEHDKGGLRPADEGGSAEGGGGAERGGADKDDGLFPEFPELLAALPPSLRWPLEAGMEALVRWGLADAFALTASLASSLPINLAMSAAYHP